MGEPFPNRTSRLIDRVHPSWANWINPNNQQLLIREAHMGGLIGYFDVVKTLYIA